MRGEGAGDGDALLHPARELPRHEIAELGELHEVEHLARLLDLAPGVRTLEIGAGSGWPGLFLARRTGCAVTLADLPREGLRVARRRSRRDRLMRRCPATVADAATLPFADASFDAVYHCDVLC